MEVDGSLRMCSQFIIAYVTQGGDVIVVGFCSGRVGVYVASSIGIKMKIPWEGLPKERGITQGRERRLGVVVCAAPNPQNS